MKSFIKGQPAELINYSFQIMLVTYLVLLLIEQVFPGVVSVYLNLHYLLVIVILLGIADVFCEKPSSRSETISRKDYVLIGFLGILGFVIIKYKTADLAWLSWVISFVAGVLIVLLSVLVLTEDSHA